MGKVQHKQDGIDGIGTPLTINGTGSIRLKAKEVQTTRNSFIKVTGMTSGAVAYIDLVVKSGTISKGYYPPSTVLNSNTPVAGFTSQIGSNTGNFNDGFANANPGFNAGSGPPNLDF